MVTVEKTESGLIITANQTLPWFARPFYFWSSTLDRVRELWSYRELVRNLMMRDLKVRYRNSVLGILWSLVNPLLMMLVFTIVFTVIAPTTDIKKFPVFILCGILPWNFFSFSVIGSIRSIVDNAPLVSKVYFPREVLPISMVLANLVNFLIALVVLFAFILVFQIPLTRWVLLLPLVILTQLIFVIGVGLIMATVNVFYRDTQVIMEVLMQAWFFLTPVFYPGDILPRNYELWGFTIDVWRLMNILNPMASIIATYRVILYGTGSGGAPPEMYFFIRTLLTTIAILGIGSFVFYRYSRTFGEEV
ncbi:MAG: ABC transporter permease [Anaerolineales bacterium]|nr:ABC transporter permease [Anaerolineales bacterium]